MGTNQYIVAFLHERYKFFGGIKKELVLADPSQWLYSGFGGEK